MVRLLLTLMLVLSFAVTPAFAATVPFAQAPDIAGGGGGGTGEVAPRGFGVDLPLETPARRWLSSGYDNTGFLAVYTGVKNGIDRLPVGAYTFNAYVDKNPTVTSGNVVAIYENGVRVPDSAFTLGTKVRDVVDPSGQTNRWRVPITGLVLKPGSVYEFAFLRGLTSNNGMTAVISADGTGYVQSPAAGAELDHYNARKGDEYQYREYEKIYDIANSNYTVHVANPAYNASAQTFRAMRFSFQTDADPAPLASALAAAKSARAGIAAADITAGVYNASAVAALDALILQIEGMEEAEIVLMLQSEIDALIDDLDGAVAAAVKKSQVPDPVVPPVADKDKTPNPKTGDVAAMAMSAGIFVTSALAVFTLRRRGEYS